MVRKIAILILLAAACLLTGCATLTVDQMYCIPKRPQSFSDLQSVIDAAMEGMDYSAPRAGEHQQTVQMADLDGDGIREYLVFARDGGDKSLKILIFAQKENDYVHTDTLECTGSSFERVVYTQLDSSEGLELLVGCQLDGQVPRSVSVYGYGNDRLQQVMMSNYTEFLTCDLNEDGAKELMILSALAEGPERGVATLYTMENGTMARSNEALLSGPVDNLKRIILGDLHGGIPAVFVGSTVDESTIMTDVYALVDGVLTNVSLSAESGTSVQTLRNYYVYADDIDNDGILELPSLITMRLPLDEKSAENQHIIRWYSMTPKGEEVDKMYTYHNFVGGWYLQLDDRIAQRIAVCQKGNSYEFGVWDPEYTTFERLMTGYVLTGQKREEQAREDNRFVVYRSESTVYAANLEVASSAYGITKDSVIKAFHLILQDWNTGET